MRQNFPIKAMSLFSMQHPTQINELARNLSNGPSGRFEELSLGQIETRGRKKGSEHRH
jgi:hypothetical protein